MAMTCTITEGNIGALRAGYGTEVVFNWTSSSNGAVSATTARKYSGMLTAMVYKPDGTDRPSDNYDSTLKADDGRDLLDGAGADIDCSATVQIPGIGGFVNQVVESYLTFNVTNAGSGKKGVSRALLK